jgi:SulP family sulfate permease
MLAAWRLVDRQQLAYHLRATRSDAWIVWLTAISAVAVSVEFCILIGVFLSFVFYVPRAARIHMTELVLAPERVVRERISSDPSCGRIRIYSLEGEFFFGAAPELEDHFEKIAGLAEEGIRAVVLRVKRARNPDAVCLAVLERFIERMDRLGVSVLLCGVRPDFMRIIEAGGLVHRLGPERVFVFQETGAVWSSTLEAIRFAYELLKGDVCPICPRYAESLQGKEGWYYMI